MADWSCIPEELLSLVCQRLDSFVQYLQFRIVCKSWRCVCYNYPLPQLPLLMLPQEKTTSTCRCSFLGLTIRGEEFDKTVYELDLPEIHQHRCVGPAGNWVVTVDMELDMHIFNLFSKVHMNLPSQSTIDTRPFKDPTINRTQLRDHMVSKVLLTSKYPKDPSKDCIAVAIHTPSGMMAIARPGDKTWTTIQNIGSSFMDIIYFKEQLYGIGVNGKLYICDIKSDPPKASKVRMSYCSWFLNVNHYLVECSGALLQVVRAADYQEQGEGESMFCTCTLYVYKLDFSHNERQPVKSFGQHALFLGYNTEDHHPKYYYTINNLDIESPFDNGVTSFT